ncbi:MAG: hypothetical protein R3E77_02100 [Steroidobacteraceae bacterium]
MKALIPLSLAVLAGIARGASVEVNAPVREANFVGYIAQQSLPYQSLRRWPSLRARILSEDSSSGRLAAYVEFPRGWHARRLPALAQSVEVIVLDGGLTFGTDALAHYDFAFVPPGRSPPSLGSRDGAHALVFFDPPAADAAAVGRQQQRGAYVTRFDPARWQPASLARSAGATADLKVMHLKKDPFTTARTWYVKLEGGMTVPWEVHSMPEEGYLMEGSYRLAECLPARTVIGNYVQGGYFWRPGGIAHSGPESGPQGPVIWLQRSPIALDVVFYQRCVAGTAGEPLRPGSKP